MRWRWLDWKVEDGLLHKLPGVKGGDIVTVKTYADFELEWEWRLAKDANNGVKYCVSEAVKAGVADSKFKKFPDFGTKIGGPMMLTDHTDECWFRAIRIREFSAK